MNIKNILITTLMLNIACMNSIARSEESQKRFTLVKPVLEVAGAITGGGIGAFLGAALADIHPNNQARIKWMIPGTLLCGTAGKFAGTLIGGTIIITAKTIGTFKKNK